MCPSAVNLKALLSCREHRSQPPSARSTVLNSVYQVGQNLAQARDVTNNDVWYVVGDVVAYSEVVVIGGAIRQLNRL